MLQCLNYIPELWSGIPASSFLAKTFFDVMSALSIAKTPVKPSTFLVALENSIHSSGNANFRINDQHDVAEIFEFLIDNLGVKNSLTEICVTVSVCCDVCFQDSIIEEHANIFPVCVEESVQASLNSFSITARDESFCYFCGELKPCDVKKSVRKVGDFLIIQLKRFVEIDGSRKKIHRKVFCNPTKLEVPVSTGDDVCIKQCFHLRAMIIHSGNLVSGHYTAIIKDFKTGPYLNFNDRAVKFCSRSDLENEGSYVLFYERTSET